MDYVSGYILSEDLKKVLLIRKNRPTWQAGKLNAIGGKIEETDLSPLFALIREVKEETGLETYESQWNKLDGIKRDGEFKLHIFYTVSDKLLYTAKTMEDEEVGIYKIDDLQYESLMNTVHFCIEKAIFLAEHKNMEVI